MRKLYPFVAILFITMTSWSQTRSWNGGNGDWNDQTKWTPFGVPSETDILDFSTSSGTISNVPSIQVKGIRLSGTDIILNAAAGGAKQIRIGSGTAGNDFVIQADASLSIGNNLDIQLAENSFAAVDGTLLISSDRTYLANAMSSRTIVKGMLVNKGGSILSTPATLEMGDGATYEHAMDKGMIPLATWHANSNCEVSGTISNAPTGLNQLFGNYIWNCRLQAAGALAGNALPDIVKGDLVVRNVGVPGDASVYIAFPGKMDISGTFLLENGVCLNKGTNATINIAGDFVMTGGLIKAVAGSSGSSININFAGNRRQSFQKTGGNIEKQGTTVVKAEVRFTVLEHATLDFGAAVLTGDASFTLAGGSTLITSHAEGIAATGQKGSVQVTGSRIFNSDASYIYTGSAQQVTGSGLPSVVKRLVIDNNAGVQSDGGVTLSKSTAIAGELILQNGFLKSGEINMLTILDGASASASNNSFVEGPVRKAGSSAFIFPTGWSGVGGGLIPIGVSSISKPSIIQAEYKRAPATNKGSTIKAPLHHISYCEYWEMFPVSGSPTAIVTMFRNSHSTCNPVSTVQDLSTIRVARSDGTAWTDIGNEDGSMNAGTGYVVSDSAGTNINSRERYFTLGNVSSARDPLPVMFDLVTAYEKNGGVNVEWSNLTERDIAMYIVERSVNGRDYAVISQHLPKSNRDDKASYVTFDASPAPGTNFYRVKTIEKNTKIIFSRIMRIDTDRPGQGFIVYPNPLRGKHLTLGLSGMDQGNYFMDILNSTGQVIYQKNIASQGSFTTMAVELPQNIKAGIYHVVVKGDDFRQAKIFIAQ
jgi:hypothetical protein